MKHPNIDCILATGGPGMVKAAYSSGNPALGVGPGNTSAVIDETADIKMAVSSILMSKSFDNGMICASEQSVVVVDSIYEEVKNEFIYRGAYLLNEDQKQNSSTFLLSILREVLHTLTLLVKNRTELQNFQDLGLMFRKMQNIISRKTGSWLGRSIL